MPTAIPKRVDVLVLGGGPAGSTAAICLARAGYSVALLERSGYDRERIGEMLSPIGNRWLQWLGVWDAFLRDAHPPSPGVVSIWDSPQPYESDFIFSPWGSGWHLDRARFDAMLARAAADAGARVLQDVKVRTCSRRERTGWRALFEHAGADQALRAKIVVDATGRAAWLAQRQSAKRVAIDRLVGIVGFSEIADADDYRTFVEATSDGWWYAARLRDRSAVAAYMTDADMLPQGKRAVETAWHQLLHKTRLAAPVVGLQSRCAPLRTASANTARLDHVAGQGWIAVGDAALSCDPLSAHGIVWAIESGVRAAEAIRHCLAGTGDAWTAYADWFDASFGDYMLRRAHYYQRVTAWPESSFWARRQESPTGIDSQNSQKMVAMPRSVGRNAERPSAV
jgi:flavin-dependent dehydrogenase